MPRESKGRREDLIDKVREMSGKIKILLYSRDYLIIYRFIKRKDKEE